MDALCTTVESAVSFVLVAWVGALFWIDGALASTNVCNAPRISLFLFHLRAF